MIKVLTFITALAAASSAQALVISSSDSNAQELTEINQSLTLDKFDSTLGTLNSIFLSLSGDAVSSLFLDNDSTNAVTFGYTSSLGLLFTSPLGLGIPGDFFTPSLSLLLWQVMPSLAGDDGDGVGSQNGGPDEQDFGSQASGNSILIDVTAFSGALAMAGGGTFGIDCSSQVNQTFIGGGGNIEAAQVTSASCGAQIEYDYTEPPTPTPVPATLALVGLGLAGLGWSRRKKS